jgi:hypothetical protein
MIIAFSRAFLGMGEGGQRPDEGSLVSTNPKEHHVTILVIRFSRFSRSID